MDLSIFFAGTAGSVPTARRGLPATLIRRGADKVLIDCGEGTQRQLIRSVGLPGPHRGLPHAPAHRPLARPAGHVEVLRSARPHGAADGLRPARHQGAARHGPAHGLRPAEVPLPRRRPGARRDRRVRRLRDPRAARPPPRRGLRVRADRGGPARPLRRRAGGQARRHARARTSGGCSAARRSTASRPSRSWARRGAAASWCSRATRRRATWCAWPPTAPTCSSTRRPSPPRSATARWRPATRPRARRPSWPPRRASALLALTHVSTRYVGGEIRDEARAIFPRTEVPRDFDLIDVPFPEKGPPELHRWDPNRPAPPEPAPAQGPIA